MGEFVNLGSFIIQFVNICIIIFVLNKFLFKPYLAFVKEEDKKRIELETAYKDMEMLKDDAKKEAQSILDDAKKEALEVKKQSDAMAKREKEKIILEAQAEGNAIISGANGEVEKMKNSMLQSLKEKVVDISLKINEKLFQNEKVSKDFVEKQLVEIK